MTASGIGNIPWINVVEEVAIVTVNTKINSSKMFRKHVGLELGSTAIEAPAITAPTSTHKSDLIYGAVIAFKLGRYELVLLNCWGSDPRFWRERFADACVFCPSRCLRHLWYFLKWLLPFPCNSGKESQLQKEWYREMWHGRKIMASCLAYQFCMKDFFAVYEAEI